MKLEKIYAFIAIILLFLAYFPYIKSTIKNEVRPHIFSYFIWFLVTFLIFNLQLKAGGGIGSWVTLSVAFIFLFIFLLSLKNGKKDIRKVDKFVLILTLLIIPFWLLTNNSIISIILVGCVDILAYTMILRKSFIDPNSESISLFIISSIRYVFVFFSMEDYNLVTLLIPIIGVFFNLLIGIVIILRKNNLKLY